ncbi:MAG TPA: radical SAM protein [Pyrinomonadaceae bacterium]|jgi:radical SAM superfamily enzyme YgiQ (UPF0313 family)
MIDVLLVSPDVSYPNESYPVDLISEKAADLRDREWVVNLGLLSVGSYLENRGLNVEILDLVGTDNHFEELTDAVRQRAPKLVGFSSVSCYSYINIGRYCAAIGDIDPNIRLIGGGQHLSAIPLTALEEIPELDCIICGEGEEGALQVISHYFKGKQPVGVPATVARIDGRIIDQRNLCAPRVNLDDIGHINYNLLPNFKLYCPEIEFSRGCPWSCNFCTDPMMFNGKVRFKSVDRFLDELEHIISTYKMRPEDMRMYFTCSTFGIKRSEIEQLTEGMIKRRLNGVSWRTETRVDSPVVDYIPKLAEAGMSVLDIGLESASPTMIQRMNKTYQDPERYLAKAEKFIARVSEFDKVVLKVNLLNHAGESPQTLGETLNFILRQREAINHISAGPVMMYPGTELADNYEQYAAKYGTSYIGGQFWDKVHAYKVNPSHELSFDQLNCLDAILCKIINSERDYFAVKAHGQLPLGMQFEDWVNGNHDFDSFSRRHAIEVSGNDNATIRSPFANLPDFAPPVTQISRAPIAGTGA